MYIFACFLQGKTMTTASGSHIQNLSRSQLQSGTFQKRHLLFHAKKFLYRNFILIEL